MLGNKDIVIYPQVSNYYGTRDLSFSSFLDCSNFPAKGTYCQYIQSKFCLVTITLIGLITLLALWSLLRRRHSCSQIDEEKIVERVLDRLKTQRNDTLSPSEKICKTNHKSSVKAAETEEESNELYKREKCISEGKEISAVMVKKSLDRMLKKNTCETPKVKEENQSFSEELKKSVDKKVLDIGETLKTLGEKCKHDDYSETNFKEELGPHTIIILTNIENHIKLLDCKIQELLHALGDKKSKSDSKSLLKSSNSFEEILKNMKDKTNFSSISSITNISMTEKLIGIEDIDLKSNQNITNDRELSKNLNEDSQVLYLDDIRNDLNNIDIELESSITSHSLTEKDNKGSRRSETSNNSRGILELESELCNQSHKNINKLETPKQYDASYNIEFSKPDRKNFQEDLNKLIQKYFGDQIANKDEYINSDDINFHKKHYEFNDDIELCKENNEKVAYLTRELKICVDEKTKLVNRYKNRDNSSSNDDKFSYNGSNENSHNILNKKLENDYIGRPLDPNVMVEFKKDLKQFLEKYFANELNNNDNNNRDRTVMDRKNEFEKQPVNANNKAISHMENEIMDIIQKELLEEKNKVNIDQTNVSEFQAQEELSEKELMYDEHYSRVQSNSELLNVSESSIKDGQSTSKSHIRPDLQQNIRQRLNNISESKIFGKELDGEHREKSQLKNELKTKLEGKFNDRVQEKSKSGINALKDDSEVQKITKEKQDPKSQFKKELEGEFGKELDGEQKEKSKLKSDMKTKIEGKIYDSIRGKSKSEISEFKVDIEVQETSKEKQKQSNSFIVTHLEKTINMGLDYKNTEDMIGQMEKNDKSFSQKTVQWKDESRITLNGEPFDDESRDVIKSELMQELIERIDDETKKFKDQLKIELLEKIVVFLINDKFEYNTKEYLLENIEKLIDDNFNKSKELLKVEFIEAIEKRLSDDTKESQDEIKTEILEEIERRMDNAKLDLEPAEHKKSMKRLIQNIGKHLPKIKRKKEHQ